MNLSRVKELLAAWEAGAATEGDLAELRRLLPAVIEAAEVPHMQAIADVCVDLVLAETGSRIGIPTAEYLIRGHGSRSYDMGLCRGYALGVRRWKPRGRTP